MPDSLSRRDLPDFTGRLARMDGALPQSLWTEVVAEAGRLVETERNYLPVHKKGGTIAYETLETHAPKLTAVYRSEAMQRLISGIVGIEVRPTPLRDQSSCSLLFYERPGDHIGWHYDHNFYKGRHFTVLIPVVNHGRGPDGLSAARLIASQNGQEVVIPTPANALIVFEGAKIRHKDANRRRRAARGVEHDLLRGPAELRLAGNQTPRQGYRLLWNPGAVELAGF
jgi:hypothetical protein